MRADHREQAQTQEGHCKCNDKCSRVPITSHHISGWMHPERLLGEEIEPDREHWQECNPLQLRATLRRLSYLRSHAHLWRATQLSRAGLGAEELASQQQSLDCADEVARSLRFENISLGLGLADLGGKSVGFVHREHQNAWSRVEVRDESCGFQSAHHWHGDV